MRAVSGSVLARICLVLVGLLLGVPIQAQERLGDVTLIDAWFNTKVIDNGYVLPLVSDTSLFLETYINEAKFQWMSPSGMSYSIEWFILDPTIVDVKTTIPSVGNVTRTLSPAFSVKFDCRNAGRTNIVMSLQFSPPTCQMPLLRFEKRCSSPCVQFDQCFGQGTVVSTPQGSACNCFANYQPACCSLYMTTDKTDVCIGEPFLINWNNKRALITDKIYVNRPRPPEANTTEVPWNMYTLQDYAKYTPGAVFRTQDISERWSVDPNARNLPTGLSNGTIKAVLYGPALGLYGIGYVDISDYSDRYTGAVSVRLLAPNTTRCRNFAAVQGLTDTDGRVNCVRGTWDTVNLLCICEPGFYGLACQHGCNGATIMTKPFENNASSSISGELVYGDQANCQWIMQPSVSIGNATNVTAIAIHFWDLATEPTSDQVLVYDEDDNLVKRVAGHQSNVETVVVRGQTARIHFLVTPQAGTPAGSGIGGFRFSYHAIGCLSGQPMKLPPSVAPGACISCPGKALRNDADGYINNAGVAFLCFGCTAETFAVGGPDSVDPVLQANPSAHDAQCDVCSDPYKPTQPDFMQCIDNWPPPSVDLDTISRAVVYFFAAATIVTSLVLAGLSHCLVMARHNRILFMTGLKFLYTITAACVCFGFSVAIFVTPQTEALCNFRIVVLDAGAILLLAAINWQVHRTAQLWATNKPISAAEVEDNKDGTNSTSSNDKQSLLRGDTSSKFETQPSPQSHHAAPPSPRGASPKSAADQTRALMIDTGAGNSGGSHGDQKSPSHASGTSSVKRSTTRWQVLLPNRKSWAQRNFALVIALAMTALDVLLLVIFFLATPLSLYSKSRRECVWKSDDKEAGGLFVLNVLIWTKLPVAIYVGRVWFRLNKLPSTINEARFLGWIIGNSVLAGVICFALVNGFGASLADHGVSTSIQAWCQIWVVIVVLALTYGTKFFEIRSSLSIKRKISAATAKPGATGHPVYDTTLETKSIDINAELYLDKNKKDGSSEAQLLLESSERQLGQIQGQLDKELQELQNRSKKVEQLKVLSYIVQKLLDNPDDDFVKKLFSNQNPAAMASSKNLLAALSSARSNGNIKPDSILDSSHHSSKSSKH